MFGTDIGACVGSAALPATQPIPTNVATPMLPVIHLPIPSDTSGSSLARPAPPTPEPPALAASAAAFAVIVAVTALPSAVLNDAQTARSAPGGGSSLIPARKARLSSE